MRATRAVINIDNLKHNVEAIKTITDRKCRICLAVKADAYGHGASGISRAAEHLGIDFLAVAAVSEAEELRGEGITLPIILLGPVLPGEADAVAALDLEVVISSQEEMKRLESAAESGTLRIHLKIDTGMGRLGCSPSEAVKTAETVCSTRGAVLAGVCTHFPVSDSSKKEDIVFTRTQIRIFSETVNDIRAAGFEPGIIHAANSGAVLNYPEAHFDMVRPGIFSYGYLPGGREGLLSPLPEQLMPKPVMSFESKLMHIKKVAAGTDISYGRKYTTKRPTWIGTIPAGYADGYNRLLSNRGRILINGESYPVAGTICMDQLMVDLGPELKADLFDRAVLFGGEEGAATAEQLTDMIGTISYELLCAISRRVPRIYRPQLP